MELMKETMQDRFGEGGELLSMDIGQGGRHGRGKQVTALMGRAFRCGACTLSVGASSRVFCCTHRQQCRVGALLPARGTTMSLSQEQTPFSHAQSLPLHLQAEVRRFLQAMAAKGTHGSNPVFSISELFSLADAIHLNVESVRDLIEGLNEAGQCQTLADCTCKMRCPPLPASFSPFKVD